MTDADRIRQWEAALERVGDAAQNYLCGRGRHAWGPVRRFYLQHDEAPISFDRNAPMTDIAYRIAWERKCLNCGKEERGE